MALETKRGVLVRNGWESLGLVCVREREMRTWWELFFFGWMRTRWELELQSLQLKKKSKGMFGNYFFLLFFVFKNNFLFLRLKNLFGNPKWTENKNCFQNSICEGNWKHVKCCFQFLIFKSQWKHIFNLMNLSHLMC